MALVVGIKSDLAYVLVFLRLLGSRIADHIFKQRPNGLSPVIEMPGNPDTSVAMVEVQCSILVLHI